MILYDYDYINFNKVLFNSSMNDCNLILTFRLHDLHT